MNNFMQEPVKGLGRNFSSFAEAVEAYMSLGGVEETKTVDGTMVVAFCRMNKIPTVYIGSKNAMQGHHYFPETFWLKNFIEKHNFFSTGNGIYFKVDAGNRPIGYLDISPDSLHNVTVDFAGDITLAEELGDLMRANVKEDEIEVKKPSFYEMVISKGGMFGGREGSLTATRETVGNIRVAKDEFYPYLEGGFMALLKDFIESDESVLILMGAPGTGKSSGISAGISALGLLPIYAKKAEVIKHSDFISEVFSFSDKYMERVAGSKMSNRSLLFTDRSLINDDLPNYFRMKEYAVKSNDDDRDEGNLIPIIIVEDGELLMKPRSSGNEMMQEFLNCADGIGSNYNRKIIITSNLTTTDDIDDALLRPGRCYGVFNFRKLTPMEAVEARAANGLPSFEKNPTENISLAEALRQPRKKIFFEGDAPVLRTASKTQH